MCGGKEKGIEVQGYKEPIPMAIKSEKISFAVQLKAFRPQSHTRLKVIEMLSQTSETRNTHLRGIIKQLNSLCTLQQSHMSFYTETCWYYNPKNKAENAIWFIVYEAQYYVVGLQPICIKGIIILFPERVKIFFVSKSSTRPAARATTCSMDNERSF